MWVLEFALEIQLQLSFEWL